MFHHQAFSFASEIVKAISNVPRRSRQQKHYKNRSLSWKQLHTSHPSDDTHCGERLNSTTRHTPFFFEFRKLLNYRPPPPLDATLDWTGIIHRIAQRFYREGLSTQLGLTGVSENSFIRIFHDAVLIPVACDIPTQNETRSPQANACRTSRLICQKDFRDWLTLLWNLSGGGLEGDSTEDGFHQVATQHQYQLPLVFDALAMQLLREFFVALLSLEKEQLKQYPLLPSMNAVDLVFEERLQLRRRVLRDLGLRCLADLSPKILTSSFPESVLMCLLPSTPNIPWRTPLSLPCEYRSFIPQTLHNQILHPETLIAWEALNDIRKARCTEGAVQSGIRKAILRWRALRPIDVFSSTTLQLLQQTIIAGHPQRKNQQSFPVSMYQENDLRVTSEDDDRPETPPEWNQVDILLRQQTLSETGKTWCLVVRFPQHEDINSYFRKRQQGRNYYSTTPILDLDTSVPLLLVRLWERLLQLQCELL